MTEGTLEDPSAAGRLQLPDEERVRVADPAQGMLGAVRDELDARQS